MEKIWMNRDELVSSSKSAHSHDWEQQGLMFIDLKERMFIFNPIVQCNSCKKVKIDLETFIFEKNET
jgi:hypothetical protein